MTKKEKLEALERLKDKAFMDMMIATRDEEYIEAKIIYEAVLKVEIEILKRNKYYRNYFPSSALTEQEYKAFAFWCKLKGV